MMVDIVDIVTILISLTAIVVSIYTFCFTKRTEKIKRTIEAYKDLQKYLYCLYEYDKNELEDFVTDSTSREYKMLSSCIAEIEIFATGIKSKIYDFDIIYRMAHGYIDGALKGRIEYLLNMKSWKNDNSFYSNTKWLLKEMQKRKG